MQIWGHSSTYSNAPPALEEHEESEATFHDPFNCIILSPGTKIYLKGYLLPVSTSLFISQAIPQTS